MNEREDDPPHREAGAEGYTSWWPARLCERDLPIDELRHHVVLEIVFHVVVGNDRVPLPRDRAHTYEAVSGRLFTITHNLTAAYNTEALDARVRVVGHDEAEYHVVGERTRGSADVQRVLGSGTGPTLGRRMERPATEGEVRELLDLLEYADLPDPEG